MVDVVVGSLDAPLLAVAGRVVEASVVVVAAVLVVVVVVVVTAASSSLDTTLVVVVGRVVAVMVAGGCVIDSLDTTLVVVVVVVLERVVVGNSTATALDVVDAGGNSITAGVVVGVVELSAHPAITSTTITLQGTKRIADVADALFRRVILDDTLSTC